MKVDIEVKKKELGNEVKRLGCCVGEKGIEEVVGKEGLNDLKKWKLCSCESDEDMKRKEEYKNCEREGNSLFNVDFEKYLIGDASYSKNKEYIEKNGITDIKAHLQSYVDEYNKTATPYKKIAVLKVRDEDFPKNTLRKIMRFKLDMSID